MVIQKLKAMLFNKKSKLVMSNHRWGMYLNDQMVTFGSLADFRGRVEGGQLNGTPFMVIASGPSVKSFDPSVIADQNVILVNGACRFFSNAQRHYFVVTDPRFVQHQSDIWAGLADMTCFFSIKVIEAIGVICPVFFECNHVVVIQDARDLYTKSTLQQMPEFKYLDPKFKVGVSLDMSKGYVEAGTVTYVAAQLAFYLGACQIDVYGMDILNANQPRFYESPTQSAPSGILKGQSRIVDSFDLLYRTYRQKGVAVVNHSPVSRDLFKMPYLKIEESFEGA